MKTRALGFLLMVAAAGVYAVGCGSSNNNGGTGGKGGAAGAGTGGAGAGGKGGAAGAGTGGTAAGGSGAGGKIDAGPDTSPGTGGKVDAGPTDTVADMAPGDVPADTNGAATWTQVFAIISDNSTATSPGCINCHDGINPADGGAATALPHSMNFKDKAAAFAALVGVPSIRCAGQDAGGDASLGTFDRVHASSAATSVLWQKVNQGIDNTMKACDSVGMPINVPKPTDGGAPDGGDAGFTTTTYAVTTTQLNTIRDWINAGALNN